MGAKRTLSEWNRARGSGIAKERMVRTRILRNEVAAVLAAAVPLFPACHGAGPYGHAKIYAAASAEEKAVAGNKEYDPLLAERALDKLKGRSVWLFGVVTNRGSGPGGATYVARGFSAKQKHLVEMMKGAIMHNGFALVDVFSPCVTYNKDNTYQWFNPRVKILEEQGHDPTDFHKALDKGYLWGDEIPIGLFWKRDLPSLEDLEPVLQDGSGPLAFRKLGITQEQGQALIKELL